MELSRSSTRLLFLAALNISYAMYNLFLEDWLNVILPMLNFFVIVFAFAAIENEIEIKQRKIMEVNIVEHI